MDFAVQKCSGEVKQTHKKQYIYENTLNPKFTQFIFSLHKMFSYISLPHQVFPLSKLQNH